MLSTILGIFTSGGFGVIAGLVGSWATKREERKTLELNINHELAMAEIEAKRDAQDQAHSLALADKGMELAQLEGEIAVDTAEMDNVGETIRAQGKSSGNAIVDGILRFVRPLITGYLLVIVTVIGFKLHTLLGGFESLPINDVFELYKHIIYQTVFLTVTAVAWWFGSRGVSKGKK